MVKVGTCSWNYPSWKGLVYTAIQPRAVDYLPEYSQHFKTVEIDSWFYKLPDRKEVEEYLSRVDSEFTFTCKVSNQLTLTHKRSFDKKKPLEANPDFLSPELFKRYLDSIEPMLPQIDAIEFEFEYLNLEKMPSLEVLLDKLSIFFDSVPKGLPYAIEVRNGPYLVKDYFAFLKEKNLAHVFSEKIYMPHIWEVVEDFQDLLTDLVVIRLLGGDRKAIEEKTKDKWDKIVEPKEKDLERVRWIIRTLPNGKKIVVSFNNHYEGSAPLSIQRFLQKK